MNYTQALHFFNSLSAIDRHEYPDVASRQKHPQTHFFKRTQFLLKILGNPEQKIPHYLHVAGTSGKGSVCGYLSTIWQNAGYKTGLFLSPHISDIRERWQVNNQLMSKKDFVRLTGELKEALEVYFKTSSHDAPSAFELNAVMGWMYFAQKKADCVVLEVGMGGRIDATNIIKHKTAAIITDIGFDHMKHLGNTIEEIAAEKAGIITTSAPVFAMTENKTAFAIIAKKATLKKAPLWRSVLADRDKKSITVSEKGTSFNYQGETYAIQAPGVHQVRNAVMAIDVANHFGIDPGIIKTSLARTIQPLRCELIQTKPYIIIDGAHNTQKMASTAATIRTLQATWHKPLHLVLGFSGDKDVRGMLKEVLALTPKTVACTKNTVNTSRKTMNPGTMLKLVKKYSPTAKGEVFLNPPEAVAWSKKQAKTNGLVLITGSIYLSGELRPNLAKK